MNDDPESLPSSLSEERRKKADQLINRYILMSVGCGFIPNPLVDAVSVAGLELIMIGELAEIYASPFPTKLAMIKAFISVVGSIGPIYVVTHSRNAMLSTIKIIPVIGYLTISTTYAAVNGIAVFAVGKVFQYHFESGGKLLNFENKLLRKIFIDEYERGKKIVPQLISEITTR